jgi:microcystin-dependent protein
MLSNQVPPHSHPINCNTGIAAVQSPKDCLPASLGDLTNPVNAYSNVAPNGTMNPLMCGPNSGGQPIDIQNPLLGLNFIIALQGIFPSRN